MRNTLTVQSVFLQILVTMKFSTSLLMELSENDDTPLKLRFDPVPANIRLGNPLTVHCELSDTDGGISKPSVFLYCPISPWGSFCFQNCKNACASEAPGKCPYDAQLNQISCRTVVSQTGLVTHEYKIPILNEDWLGRNEDGKAGFYCTSTGYKTREVWLSPEEIKHSPTSKTNAPSNNHVNEIKPKVTVAVKTTPKLFPVIYPQSLRSHVTMREVLIIAALIIICISLSINIFCCIRCVLIRQYSRGKESIRMGNFCCMLEEIRTSREITYINQRASSGCNHASMPDQNNIDKSYLTDRVLLNSNLLCNRSSGMVSQINTECTHPQRKLNENSSNTTMSAVRSMKDQPYVFGINPHNNNSLFCLTQQPGNFFISDKHRPKTCSLASGSETNSYQQLLQAHIAEALSNFFQQQGIVQSSEFAQSVHRTGSDGIGSCLSNSIDNGESVVTDIPQMTSSNLGTLQRRKSDTSGSARQILIRNMISPDGQSTVPNLNPQHSMSPLLIPYTAHHLPQSAGLVANVNIPNTDYIREQNLPISSDNTQQSTINGRNSLLNGKIESGTVNMETSTIREQRASQAASFCIDDYYTSLMTNSTIMEDGQPALWRQFDDRSNRFSSGMFPITSNYPLQISKVLATKET